MSVLRGVAGFTCRMVLDVCGRRDAGRLSRHIEELRQYEEYIASNHPDFTAAYEKYITEVSSEDMAISFEASQLVFALAKIRRATRVADLGSGFSSYILRQYASTAGENVEVYSVDDNPRWLQKTRDFLEGMNVSSENVMSWEDFKGLKLDPFDLILHDLGHTDGLRLESLPHIIGLLKSSGILILDDMHKGRGGLIGGYRAKATDLVRQAGLSLFSARKFTLDKYGRFCEVALPIPKKNNSDR